MTLGTTHQSFNHFHFLYITFFSNDFSRHMYVACANIRDQLGTKLFLVFLGNVFKSYKIRYTVYSLNFPILTNTYPLTLHFRLGKTSPSFVYLVYPG